MRSVGYSDLFVLSKKDMWDVLKEYPAARVRLEAIAVKRLEKYKKAPLEKGMRTTSLRVKIKCTSLCYTVIGNMVNMTNYRLTAGSCTYRVIYDL